MTDFVLKVHPLTLIFLGFVDEGGNMNYHRFAKVLRRIAAMCEDKWWETNNIDNPPPEGNDCFYFDATDALTGKKFVFEAVPGKRPNVYLWMREEKETRNFNEMTSFRHPQETILMEKAPKESPLPSKN